MNSKWTHFQQETYMKYNNQTILVYFLYHALLGLPKHSPTVAILNLLALIKSIARGVNIVAVFSIMSCIKILCPPFSLYPLLIAFLIGRKLLSMSLGSMLEYGWKRGRIMARGLEKIVWKRYTIVIILFCCFVCSEKKRRKLTSPVVGVNVPHDDVIAHSTQGSSGGGAEASKGWAHVPRLHSYQRLNCIVHFSCRKNEREERKIIYLVSKLPATFLAFVLVLSFE